MDLSTLESHIKLACLCLWLLWTTNGGIRPSRNGISPQRLKKIIWLVMEDKILTWSNLQKRGIQGPSICPLCILGEDSRKHLFLNYSFSVNVWKLIHLSISSTDSWRGFSIQDRFLSWFTQNKSHGELACFIIWEIWKARNLYIFEDKMVTPEWGNRLASAAYFERLIPMEKPLQRCPCSLSMYESREGCWDQFDGASQSNASLCGAGAAIFWNQSEKFLLWMNCGVGNNTK